MPKQQANSKPNNSFAWLLKFIASAIFVYSVAQIWLNQPVWLSGGLSSSIPTLGLGIIAATAIMSSVGLFLATLFSFKMGDDKGMMSTFTWKMAMWSSFTLLVITLQSTWSQFVLVGFILYSIGSAASRTM